MTNELDPNHGQGDSMDVASFRIEQNSPAATVSIEQAAKAVQNEYHECSRWKRLSCRQVSLYAERGRGTVFVVHVGSAVQFDWTWEGAVAFRPKSIDDFGMLSDLALEDTIHNDEVEWSGEILQVDEQNGCLFLNVDNADCPPTAGSFFVRPFEFLAVLEAVYNDAGFQSQQARLPARLQATCGGVHPVVKDDCRGGLPELALWWRHAWSVLWGPPGTGKTFTTGQQVAAVLRDDPQERVLIVSTTNKATDEVAKSIGHAAKQRFPTSWRQASC